ncbi:MAG: hypothetical protein H0W83_11665 [Planctomycetes bacterium]|nr:hypothetical protein [Planctomycetota bacterium]
MTAPSNGRVFFIGTCSDGCAKKVAADLPPHLAAARADAVVAPAPGWEEKH